MKKADTVKVNDVKTLKRNVGNFAVELEKGDRVEIIYIGDRGYDVKHIESGEVVTECGWDLFE